MPFWHLFHLEILNIRDVILLTHSKLPTLLSISVEKSQCSHYIPLLLSPRQTHWWQPQLYFMQASTSCKQPGSLTLYHEKQPITRLSLPGAFSTPLSCKTPPASPQNQLDQNRGITLSSHPSGAPSDYQGCSIARTWVDTGYLGKVDCRIGWERKCKYSLMTSVKFLVTQTCSNSLGNTCIPSRKVFQGFSVSGISSVPQRSYLFSGLHKNFRGKLPHFRHSVVQKEPLALPHVLTGQSQSQTSLGLNCHHLIFLSGPVPKLEFLCKRKQALTKT